MQTCPYSYKGPSTHVNETEELPKKSDTLKPRTMENLHKLNLFMHRRLGRAWLAPFILGPIYPFTIPHLWSKKILGFPEFNFELAKKLEKLATKHNHIASFWLGPYPAFYISSNAVRSAIVRESHVGNIDEKSVAKVKKWMKNNEVMMAFPVFQNINSKTYKEQRSFLVEQYTRNASSYLPTLETEAYLFLNRYKNRDTNIKDLVFGLVLKVSSRLLGLNQWTLDNLLLDELKTQAIKKVAHYLITENGNPDLEQDLHAIFTEIFCRNFESISSESNHNLIRNIFDSRSISFPKTLDAFYKIDWKTRHSIAMNFMATAMGGMVHSTSNSLDWALARLLSQPKQLAILSQLVRRHDNVPLSNPSIYDKQGSHGPICAWILENIFINPTFSHEFYFTRKAHSARLPDGTPLEIPSNCVVIVNYKACNISEPKLRFQFSDSLRSRATVERFIHDPRNASFGGSRIRKDSQQSRICPGAKVSLYEQMLLLSLLLKSFNLNPSRQISLEVEESAFPLRERVNVGKLKIS